MFCPGFYVWMCGERMGILTCVCVTQDNVLLRIRGEGLTDEAGEEVEQSGRVMYVVHPNCAIDE